MEKIKFYFDPRCPWCYQANRWVRQLEAQGEVELDWGLYCLEVANLKEGEDAFALKDTARSAGALRAAAAIRTKEDSLAIGRFYKALGDRVWETDTPMKDRDEAVRESLVEAGFEASLFDEAIADDATWQAVLDDHEYVVKEKGAIGVPTVVLDGGEGRAFFGPVIADPVDDATALELWKHVSWLGQYDNFFELKLSRKKGVNLPGWNVGAAGLTFGPRPWVSMYQEEWTQAQKDAQAAARAALG